MNIFSCFLKYVIPTTYAGVFFLRIFHYGFIYRHPASILADCLPTVLITASLIFIVCIAEKKILTPFEQVIQRLKNEKGKAKEADAVTCMKAYKKFDLAIAIGEGIGFLLGSSSTAIIESLTGVSKFDPLLFIIIVAQSVGVGFICYTLIIFRVKKIHMAEAMREVGLSIHTDLSKTLSVAITTCVYISIFNMMTVPIGILKSETPLANPFQSFLIYSLIGGLLTAAVCYITYSLLVKKIQENERSISKKLNEETLNLAAATKESAASCMDQSAAVKEIVATIEDTKNMSFNITEKLKNVSQLTEKEKNDVLIGVEYLDRNVKELLSVMKMNSQTIEGIKELGDKVNNIWDVVSIINDVASQAKIIAFNAELEASSAGEYGKNFHIVASEVRRLSDNIIESTKEIKDKITEVQGASDVLILASENGAKEITAGYENIQSLQKKFTSLKDSAEDTAKSSNEITDVVQQLSVSHEQIYCTIKQISEGIENFTQTTENISASSQNVKNIAQML